MSAGPAQPSTPVLVAAVAVAVVLALALLAVASSQRPPERIRYYCDPAAEPYVIEECRAR